MTNEELLKGLINYLENKQVSLNDGEKGFIKNVIELASNNGYRKALGIGKELETND